MNRDFDKWIAKFKNNITSYDYFVNYAKVIENVEKVKVELNILNSLIGSKNIEKDFVNLIQLYPQILKCIPLLLAVRENEIRVQDAGKDMIFNFRQMNYSVAEYIEFCNKTGLFNLISNHLINNLYDYALGVETGLDSHARKNRGGKQMELLVEKYLQRAGLVVGLDYIRQASLQKAIKRWDVILPMFSEMDRAIKVFDFVVYVNGVIYGIETNFYRGEASGSKLNETAKSYELIATLTKQVERFKFIWITDGPGWIPARRSLKDTFMALETLYNIDDLENGKLSSLFGRTNEQ